MIFVREPTLDQFASDRIGTNRVADHIRFLRPGERLLGGVLKILQIAFRVVFVDVLEFGREAIRIGIFKFARRPVTIGFGQRQRPSIVTAEFGQQIEMSECLESGGFLVLGGTRAGKVEDAIRFAVLVHPENPFEQTALALFT